MKRFFKLYYGTILLVVCSVAFVAYANITVTTEQLEAKFKEAKEYEDYREEVELSQFDIDTLKTNE